MQVILLEKLHNLGNLGDTVKVKAGYGRNYLIPNGKAVPATDTNVRKFEARRAELEKLAQESLAAAKARAEGLAELAITISAKAGDEGKLFGSIGNRDVADAITKAGRQVSKSEVILPQGLIRLVGEHEIFIQLHGDLRVPVKINVVQEA